MTTALGQGRPIRTQYENDRIGEAIAGRRKDLVLCTKIPPITRSWLTCRRRPPRTKDVRRTLEESLGRLKYISRHEISGSLGKWGVRSLSSLDTSQRL